VILRHTHASTVPVRTKYVQHLSLLASSLPFDPPRNSFDFYPRPKPPQTLSPSTRASLESPSNVSYPAGLACPTLPPRTVPSHPFSRRRNSTGRSVWTHTRHIRPQKKYLLRAVPSSVLLIAAMVLEWVCAKARAGPRQDRYLSSIRQ
jgi:hypothetical protein